MRSGVRKRIISRANEDPRPVVDLSVERGSRQRRAAGREVEELARRFRLTEKPSRNPQLAFGKDEISYWQGQNLSTPELELEFEARRIILDAAERQNVHIRDQEMLSRAAREFILSVIVSEDIAVKDSVQVKPEQLPNVSSLICEGDTSEAVIRQAWEGLNAGNGGLGVKELEKALACTKVAIDTWASQADEQQARWSQATECKVTPKAQDKDSYFSSSWALSDVATAWFIRGQVFAQQKKWKEAREAYKVVINKYPCAYTWDPRGWFWRTAEGAERELKKVP